MKVVVGIPAKNEEKTILHCLESVVSATLHLQLDVRIVVCANQCVDNTIKLVKDYIHSNRYLIELIVLDEGNLVESQRIIVSRYLADIYVFVDADVVIEKKSIAELINAMNEKVYITYAETRLVPKLSKENVITSTYRLYSSGELLTKRCYFHGRFFATRAWNIPNSNEVARRHQLNMTLAKFGGLIVDDIYLSAWVLKQYGPNSIQEVKSAIVYSTPIDNLSDWWKTFRRTQIEVKKILSWFPEMHSIKNYLYRKTNWQNWNRTSLQKKLLWVLYLIMKQVFQIALNIELLLVKIFRITPAEQWLKSESTKKDLDLSQILLLIDIDDTLIVNNEKIYEDEKVVDKIRELISRGTIVGLNTARDTNGARKIYDRLQLNGPIIVEQGSLVYIKTNAGFKEFVPMGVQTNYDLVDLVTKVVKKTIGKKTNFIYTKKDKLTEKHKGLLIAISDRRKFSISLYCYFDGKPSKYWTKYLFHGLIGELAGRGIAVDKLVTYGKLHIYLQNTNKLSAARIVLNKYFKNKTLCIVGDNETNDYNNKMQDVILLGVKNSKASYKETCDYVAKNSGAEGLYELFDYLGRV